MCDRPASLPLSRSRRLVARGAGLAMLAWAGSAAAQGETPRATEPSDPNDWATWSGPYLGVGGSAGASFGKFRFEPGAARIPATSGFSQSGGETPWLGGGFAGYSWQAGRIVFGTEVGALAAPFKRALGEDGAGAGAFRIKRDAAGSARARLGYAVDNFLLYGTMGLAAISGRSAAIGAGSGWRGAFEPVGYTVGIGIEAAVTPHLALGLDYQRGEFRLGRGPDGPGLPAWPRARSSIDDVTARLTWYPEGLGLVPPPGDAPEGEVADWSIHGQTTFIQQAVPRFRSPYSGDFSFQPRQSRETWTVTGYLGRRLWDGAELYFNPELNQGFGLSRTLGIAGFVNGEAQKAGASYPKFRPQRYFLRQTFGLGGETETVADGLNQIAGSRDVDRITVTVGKFAVGDFFDDNAYAHDPRLNFQNWSLWGASAYDFPANIAGFTQGAVVELNTRERALRAGFFQVPKLPNDEVLDPRIDRKNGSVVELEERYELWDQPGKIRLGAFTNTGRTANYRQALAFAAARGDADPNDAAAANRRDRSKQGVYANLEHALTADLGLFARASLNDGRNEILSFTDVDRSVSGGFALKGTGWERPKDTFGVGLANNLLSKPHRDFLAAGGLGLLIGDGRLNYRPERALEAYYRLSLTRAVDLTFDYQFVANPGYNADRGPVNAFGLRLHAEF